MNKEKMSRRRFIENAVRVGQSLVVAGVASKCQALPELPEVVDESGDTPGLVTPENEAQGEESEATKEATEEATKEAEVVAVAASLELMDGGSRASKELVEVIADIEPEIKQKELVLMKVSVEDNQGGVRDYVWMRGYEMIDGELRESNYWVHPEENVMVKLSTAEGTADEAVVLGTEVEVGGEKFIKDVFLRFNRIENYPGFEGLSGDEIREVIDGMGQAEKDALVEYIDLTFYLSSGDQELKVKRAADLKVLAEIVPERVDYALGARVADSENWQVLMGRGKTGKNYLKHKCE